MWDKDFWDIKIKKESTVLPVYHALCLSLKGFRSAAQWNVHVSAQEYPSLTCENWIQGRWDHQGKQRLQTWTRSFNWIQKQTQQIWSWTASEKKNGLCFQNNWRWRTAVKVWERQNHLHAHSGLSMFTSWVSLEVKTAHYLLWFPIKDCEGSWDRRLFQYFFILWHETAFQNPTWSCDHTHTHTHRAQGDFHP